MTRQIYALSLPARLMITQILTVATVAATAALAPAAIENLDVAPVESTTDSSATHGNIERDETSRSPFDDLPVDVKASPYRIKGTSRQEIRRAISDSLAGEFGEGPEDHFGAITVSEYTFDITGMPILTKLETADSCRCRASDSVAVSLALSVRYPVWAGMDSCHDKDLVDDWRGYVTALYYHELGHIYIARAGLSKLRDRLNGIEAGATDKDCGTACLRAVDSHYDQVQEEFFRISGEISRHHERYDLETAYGRSQGAAF